MSNHQAPRCDKGDVEVDIDFVHGRASDGFICVRPADKLEGRVRVSSKQRLHFSKAEIYLHGKPAHLPWTIPINGRRKYLSYSLIVHMLTYGQAKS